MWAERPLRDVLESFAAPAPTPGGGSASALAGALGVSLLRMVAGLPRTRHNSPEEREHLASAAQELVTIQSELTRLMEDDARAYDGVVDAYKRPKGTPEEQASRRAAIEAALHDATDVPLMVMRRAAQALELGRSIAPHVNLSAGSDHAIGLELLRSAVRGAWLNVEVNLDGVKDAEYASRTREDGRALLAAAVADRRA